MTKMIYNKQTQEPLLSIFIVRDQNKELSQSQISFWIKSQLTNTKKVVQCKKVATAIMICWFCCCYLGFWIQQMPLEQPSLRGFKMESATWVGTNTHVEYSIVLLLAALKFSKVVNQKAASLTRSSAESRERERESHAITPVLISREKGVYIEYLLCGLVWLLIKLAQYNLNLKGRCSTFNSIQTTKWAIWTRVQNGAHSL